MKDPAAIARDKPPDGLVALVKQARHECGIAIEAERQLRQVVRAY